MYTTWSEFMYLYTYCPTLWLLVHFSNLQLPIAHWDHVCTVSKWFWCCLKYVIYDVLHTVAFKMYDLDDDDKISRDELLAVLHMMVGANISEEQVSYTAYHCVHIVQTLKGVSVACSLVWVANTGTDNGWGNVEVDSSFSDYWVCRCNLKTHSSLQHTLLADSRNWACIPSLLSHF